MISVIIPAYNEEERISKLIHFLNASASKNEIEIIVSDGGSTDNTVKKSLKAGAKVIYASSECRALQMNMAAQTAQGEHLFFLHADTYPPESFVEDVNSCLMGIYVGGCYQLSFDMDNTLLKFYSWFTKFDFDLFRFGDQGLFIKKAFFEKIKGFDNQLYVMEDQEIIKRIKSTGKFKILERKVITSARKYKKIGIVKLQLIFTLILVLYYLGINQNTLKILYKKLLKSSGY